MAAPARYLAVVIGLAIAASLGWRAADSGGLAPNRAPLLGLAACGVALGFYWLRQEGIKSLRDRPPGCRVVVDNCVGENHVICGSDDVLVPQNGVGEL